MAEAETKSTGRNGQSLVQHVVDQITLGVEQGRYAPGQRLIAADLAEEFDVSRAPVREALHVLSGEGVVDLVPNRGAMIRKASAKEIRDLLEFTEAICVVGVRRASALMEDAEKRAFLDQAIQRVMDAHAAKIPLQFIRSLYQYHVDVNSICGNEYVNFYYRRMPFHWYNSMFADNMPGTVEEWDQFLRDQKYIHDSILSGDPHTATAAFVNHMRWVISLVRE